MFRGNKRRSTRSVPDLKATRLLRRGPDGWRHRLALIVAADLSWFAGDRIGPDRLALWISLRLSGVQDDTADWHGSDAGYGAFGVELCCICHPA
jgi:hypothetical protein